MLTNEQTDASYQQAFAALHSVVIDPAATPEQQSFAREKRDLLTLEYVGHAIANIEERTRQFRKFIGEMKAVIAEFGSGSTIAGIRRLQGIVEAAGELVGAALEPATAAKTVTGKPARKAPKRGAKKPSKKARKKAAKGPAKKLAKKPAKKPAKKAAGKKSNQPARKAAKKPARKAAKRPAPKARAKRARPAKRGR
jgi:hypothetical protein